MTRSRLRLLTEGVEGILGQRARTRDIKGEESVFFDPALLFLPGRNTPKYQLVRRRPCLRGPPPAATPTRYVFHHASAAGRAERSLRRESARRRIPYFSSPSSLSLSSLAVSPRGKRPRPSVPPSPLTAETAEEAQIPSTPPSAPARKVRGGAARVAFERARNSGRRPTCGRWTNRRLSFFCVFRRGNSFFLARRAGGG